MIINFAVRNYKSLSTEQELTMIPAPRISEHESTHVFVTPDEQRLLRVALIYGPNASGKSNVLHALRAIRQLVAFGAKELEDDSELNQISPFRLDEIAFMQPSRFSINFIADGVRYEYALSATRTEIVEERLHYYPEKHRRKLFSRSQTSIETGPDLKSDTISSLKSLGQRRRNVPFLSVLGQNSEPGARAPYKWFLERLRYSLSPRLSDLYSKKLITENSEAKSFITDLLCLGDFGIQRLDVHKEPYDVPEAVRVLLQEATKRLVPEEFERLQASFWHGDGSLESAAFSEDDESMGTLQLLSMAGPLYDVFQHGRIMVLDELDASLHPDLVKSLVGLFNNPDFNSKGAQLIANTHDVTQLDLRHLRRDNIWFTEKSREGSTTLYPLTDFNVRKDLALQKNYLDGRFGAIPSLGYSLLSFSDVDNEEKRQN